MQPCLLTREKYTFPREIKLHLLHCCIPSDIATHLASPRSQRREREVGGGGREGVLEGPTKKQKETASTRFSDISGETM